MLEITEDAASVGDSVSRFTFCSDIVFSDTFQNGIPYHYKRKLTVSDGYWARDQKLRPRTILAVKWAKSLVKWAKSIESSKIPEREKLRGFWDVLSCSEGCYRTNSSNAGWTSASWLENLDSRHQIVSGHCYFHCFCRASSVFFRNLFSTIRSGLRSTRFYLLLYVS